MKKISLLITLIFAFALNSLAKPRTAEQMKAAAAAVLNTQTMAKGLNFSAADVTLIDSRSQTVIYGNAGGYAVVSKDDTFSPILGYSDTAMSDNPAPAFLWWLETINKSMENMLANGTEPQHVQPAPEYRTSVPELLTTRWGQDTPYNLQCPEYTVNNVKYNYVTGCVATAMAQIMKYHNYPEKGYGKTIYRLNPGDGATLTIEADFGNTTYDWANMLDSYIPGRYNDEQANAVATIMYHCGVSVRMNYAKDGSGAFSYDACTALRTNFLYDKNIKHYSRDFMPNEEWMNIIYRELNDNCPILYGGVTTANAGHAFVFDGYDADGLVHVNWGWNGESNGYYDVASLNGFSEGQNMVIIRLPNDDRFESQYHSMWGLGYKLVITKTITALKVSCDALYNMDVDKFTGELALMALNTETGDKTNLSTIYGTNVLSGIKYGSGMSLSGVSVPYTQLSDGTYRIYLATKSTLETDWQPVHSNETINNSYILVKNGSNVTLRAENNSNWTTAIDNVPTVEKKADNRIYSIDGRYMGTDASVLKDGIYIRNGKKFVK
ncbi:C10 family peptidase [Prevotella sp. HCN-7019]|uniref:C10 family peptidase n=1 Tax=Prevotella sp. HCN-7019 TaxID=3134668 RepID=UPI0030BC7244